MDTAAAIVECLMMLVGPGATGAEPAGVQVASVTHVLLANVSTVTGTQTLDARRALVTMARMLGWIED